MEYQYVFTNIPAANTPPAISCSSRLPEPGSIYNKCNIVSELVREYTETQMTAGGIPLKH